MPESSANVNFRAANETCHGAGCANRLTDTDLTAERCAQELDSQYQAWIQALAGEQQRAAQAELDAALKVQLDKQKVIALSQTAILRAWVAACGWALAASFFYLAVT
jgi:hypothetical protein